MIEQLMQIDRSITGDGVRKSLDLLQHTAQFEIHEVPSGTQVFDWKVPQEWIIRDAVLSDDTGRVWADYKKDFLHVVSYSEPVDKDVEYDELKMHLHTSSVDGAVPYGTSYYNKNWGFCMTKESEQQMNPKANYHVKIDSEFKDGSLTYGEKIIEGDKDEYIISAYCCHPNMVNDNTAGMAMWADLLSGMGKTKHTYRFVLAPETIGMITYLATHDVSNVKGAIVLSHTVGQGNVGFKKSFLGNSYMDRVARQAMGEHDEQPFTVRGGDERQLSSPSFRIPTILVNKGGFYTTNYHTSLDRTYRQSDYDTTLGAVREIIDLIERDKVFDSLNPSCEPMLGKRNLYPQTGGKSQTDKDSEALLNVMFYSGKSLLEIAEATGMGMRELVTASDVLERNGLIK